MAAKPVRPNWSTSANRDPLIEPGRLKEAYAEIDRGMLEGPIYVAPEEPVTMGAPPAGPSLYAPSVYKGLIEAATFLVDIPVMAAGFVMGEGAEALGFPESAKRFKRAYDLSDIATTAFEAPATIVRSIPRSVVPGEKDYIASTLRYLTQGFNATPREALNKEERFWRDVFYISGGGLSFPTALGGIFGTWRAPVSKLLQDTFGRGVNSPAATNALERTISIGGPDPRNALIETARQYASKFTVGGRGTLIGEQLLATSAGLGYGAPELFTDDAGKIEVDLGGDTGTVDILPIVKMLTSIGLPIGAMHTPSGLTFAGDKTKLFPLLRWMQNKAQIFAGSLIGGFREKGQQDLASRIFVAMESEQGFFENVFLPAVESGQFQSPGSSTPIRILEDGTVIPEYGGLRPDTLQALKLLGLDDTRLAALDAALSGRGKNLQARLTEKTRRAEQLDETFNLLKSKIDAGDEAAAYNTVKKARENLDEEALDTLEEAIAKARDVYVALEPAIGADQASRLAVEMLDGARLASREVRRKLWHKDLIGTEIVDTSSFGDWAMQQILAEGRTVNVIPGMGIFYKLAGKQRLNDNGIGDSGKPLTTDDLQGVKGEGDNLLTPDEIAENGIYDIFGTRAYSEPSRINQLDKFRSEIGDRSRTAYKRGDQKLGRRYGLIIDYIDDELLAAKNFENANWSSGEPSRNLRNIEIARGYSKNAKERFGPNSEIGRILYRGEKPLPEEFLQRFLKTGAGSGARVDLFRDALNEPQQVVQGSSVTWRRDPAATLTVGGDPNVIEAELLRRFTESVPYGKVTQNNVDRFLRQYGNAVDQISGLRKKFQQLKGLQATVDVMTSKLTVPDREKVLSAVRQGATLEDVVNARRLLLEDLTDRRLANTASDYLDADVDQAAARFISGKPKWSSQRAEQIAALLAKDDSGAAAAGFRAALWRALRESSRRFNNDGLPMPGVETKKLIDTIERIRPYLQKFYDKSSMEFLDELVKGGPLQRTGTGSPFEGTPADVMGANFATIETVGAAGRTLGQKFFGAFGINPLVATGMGRRIAAYTFTKIGEERILKYVEDALRDPVKAAELIKRYKNLNKWEPSPTTKQIAEDIVSDPVGVTKGAAVSAADRLARTAEFVSKYLKGYSMEAVRRAVRFGLIPAQAESRAIDVETDYQMGPPFIYEDNKIRYEIEEAADFPRSPATPPQHHRGAGRRSIPPPVDIQYVRPPDPGYRTRESEEPPVATPPRHRREAWKPWWPRESRPIVADSTLDTMRPVGNRPVGAQSPPVTPKQLEDIGMPLFTPFNKGGIASIRKKKPRQMVY